MRLPGSDLLQPLTRHPAETPTPAFPIGPRTASFAQSRSPDDLRFALSQVPFSRRGSWLALNRLDPSRAAELGKPAGLYLRTCHGGLPMADREIFLLRPGALNGAHASFTEDASPSRLALVGSGPRRVEAVFTAPDTLRIRGRACTLRLDGAPRAYDFIRSLRPGSWELNLHSRRIQVLVTTLAGRPSVRAPWGSEGCDAIDILLSPDPRQPEGWWEVELREFTSTCPGHASSLPFEDAVAEVAHEFSQWLQLAPAVPPALRPARALAAYVQWASLAVPSGRLIREAMLMSKDRALNLWSWDHCFNAISLAAHQPRLAWDQWALPFDFQNAHGALPDCVNDHDIAWNFTKPPVHGWALREMMARGFTPDHAQLRQARAWLARWTEWWLHDRDEDEDGIPQYNHGNDSGCDNASVFSAGAPVESPDLSAFLAIQMDVLAELCERLDRAREAARWRTQASALVARLLEHSWCDDRFVALRPGDHAPVATGDSLLCLLPLLLGKRLPIAVRSTLVGRLSAPGAFLTPYGPATESLASSFHRENDYRRGQIWAPATLLLHSALRACEHHSLAADLAARFCAHVAEAGFAENFDPDTGRPRRDHAHTWTAGVFLVLASAP